MPRNGQREPEARHSQRAQPAEPEGQPHRALLTRQIDDSVNGITADDLLRRVIRGDKTTK
ncbi:hypothetical protein GCM10009753_10300 [Streptantibioticus ferralitis]